MLLQGTFRLLCRRKLSGPLPKDLLPLGVHGGDINNGGGFYRTEFYIHEARMQGGEIEGPCINNSVAETTLYGKTIYLGFSLIKDLQAPRYNKS